MQSSMKTTLGLLLVIVVLTCSIYLVSKKSKTYKPTNKNSKNKKNTYGVPLPQANTSPNPSDIPYVISMPTQVPLDSNVIGNYPDLDRMYLEREVPSLLPANEEILTSYKDWEINGAPVDKELYAKDAPLFNSQSQIGSPVAPPDINGTQRRVNFY